MISRAVVVSAAGDAAWKLGRGLNVAGLWFCGLSGSLHGWADTLGYWEQRRTAAVSSEQEGR